MSQKVQAKRERRERAHLRSRKRVHGTPERPRLAVYRSLRYLYAQLVDDTQGVTLAQANSSEDGLRSGLGGSTKSIEAAKAVGKLIAERAMSKRASTRWFSIVAASSTTAGSRPWRKAPASRD